MGESSLTRRYYSVKEFHAELGGVISMGKVYKMITDGEVPIRRFGRKIVIPATWAQSYLNRPCNTARKGCLEMEEA